MNIERNLRILLRSQIERIIESNEEFTSRDVLVNKDRGQRNNDESPEKEKNPDSQEPESDTEISKEKNNVATVFKRLDLIV